MQSFYILPGQLDKELGLPTGRNPKSYTRKSVHLLERYRNKVAHCVRPIGPKLKKLVKDIVPRLNIRQGREALFGGPIGLPTRLIPIGRDRVEKAVLTRREL
jgi:hypothetical protein